MPMDRHTMLALLVSLLIAPPGHAADPSDAAMNRLASAKGCYLCHRAESGQPNPHAMLPFAPSWKDIALEYKGQKGAEKRLTAIVFEGSGSDAKKQLWYGKVGQVGMLANRSGIDRNQARQLVHWILSSAP
jgi:cytochrome c